SETFHFHSVAHFPTLHISPCFSRGDARSINQSSFSPNHHLRATCISASNEFFSYRSAISQISQIRQHGHSSPALAI
ncbi:hypothetical protein CEXT_552401, partial [Caerostris extrusa]